MICSPSGLPLELGVDDVRLADLETGPPDDAPGHEWGLTSTHSGDTDQASELVFNLRRRLKIAFGDQRLYSAVKMIVAGSDEWHCVAESNEL